MKIHEPARHASRVAVLTFLLCGLVSGLACAADRFVLQRGPRGYWHLSMPSHVAVALRDSAPTIQPWPDSAYARSVRSAYPYDERTAPFAIIRDVNGDGVEDLVLDGRRDRGILEVLLVISRGDRFLVMPAIGLGKTHIRTGGGLMVGKATDSTYVFTWSAIKDDPSRHFTWSDSLGFRSWEN